MLRPAIAILFFEKSKYGDGPVVANELKDMVVLSDEDITGIKLPDRFELTPINPQNSFTVRWHIVSHYMNLFGPQEKSMQDRINRNTYDVMHKVKTFVVIDDQNGTNASKICIVKPDGDKEELLSQEIMLDNKQMIRVYFWPNFVWKEETLVFVDQAGFATAEGETCFEIYYVDSEGIERCKKQNLCTLSMTAKDDEEYLGMIDDLVSIYEDIIIDADSVTSISKGNLIIKDLNKLEYELNRLTAVAEETLLRKETKVRENKLCRYTAKTVSDISNDLNSIRTVVDYRSYNIYEHRMIVRYLDRIEKIARRKIREIEIEDNPVVDESDFEIIGYSNKEDKNLTSVEINIYACPKPEHGDVTFFEDDGVVFKRKNAGKTIYELLNKEISIRENSVYRLKFKAENRTVLMELIRVLNILFEVDNELLKGYRVCFQCHKEEDCYDIYNIKLQINTDSISNNLHKTEVKQLISLYGDNEGCLNIRNSYEKLSFDRNLVIKEILNLLGKYKVSECKDIDEKLKALNHIIDMQTRLSVSEWKDVIKRVNKIKKHEIIKNININNNVEYLKITNLFSNHNIYRSIFQILYGLPDDSFLVSLSGKNKLAIAKLCNIYEYWCLVKILYIFVNVYGFVVLDEDKNAMSRMESKNIIKAMIKDYFANPATDRGTLSFKLKRSFLSYNANMNINLIYQGEICKASNDKEFYRPDFLMKIKYTSDKLSTDERCIAFDAKYRNFKAQTRANWCKTLYEVAAYKYMADAKGIDCAYILQSYQGNAVLAHDKPENGVIGDRGSRILIGEYYGYDQYELLKVIEELYYQDGYDKQKEAIENKFGGGKVVDGRIGVVGFSPSNTTRFKNLIRMIMERFVICEFVMGTAKESYKTFIEKSRYRVYPITNGDDGKLNYVEFFEDIPTTIEDEKLEKIYQNCHSKTASEIEKSNRNFWKTWPNDDSNIDISQLRVKTLMNMYRGKFGFDDVGFDKYIEATEQKPDEIFFDVCEFSTLKVRDKEQPTPPVFCWMCGDERFIYDTHNYKGSIGEPYLCLNPFCEDPFMIKSWCGICKRPMVKHHIHTYNVYKESKKITYDNKKVKPGDKMFHVCPACHGETGRY